MLWALIIRTKRDENQSITKNPNPAPGPCRRWVSQREMFWINSFTFKPFLLVNYMIIVFLFSTRLCVVSVTMPWPLPCVSLLDPGYLIVNSSLYLYLVVVCCTSVWNEVIFLCILTFEIVVIQQNNLNSRSTYYCSFASELSTTSHSLHQQMCVLSCQGWGKCSPCYLHMTDKDRDMRLKAQEKRLVRVKILWKWFSKERQMRGRSYWPGSMKFELF